VAFDGVLADEERARISALERPSRARGMSARIVVVAAEMIGDLALGHGLRESRGQRLRQPTLAGQLQPARASPVGQPVSCSSTASKSGRAPVSGLARRGGCGGRLPGGVVCS
jgi:hypothetical protein